MISAVIDSSSNFECIENCLFFECCEFGMGVCVWRIISQEAHAQSSSCQLPDEQARFVQFRMDNGLFDFQTAYRCINIPSSHWSRALLAKLAKVNIYSLASAEAWIGSRQNASMIRNFGISRYPEYLQEKPSANTNIKQLCIEWAWMSFGQMIAIRPVDLV